MSNFPRITFGMIILNGEPFTRYNLRALYPFAHQIIVVEGAAPAAANIATSDGHSSDGTLEFLRHFQAHEDPEDKLVIVTSEDEGYPDGFWPGEKDEQSRAYAKRATGDYLWQVDVDEFYKPDDMQKVIEMLRRAPDITAVSFKTVTLWGGLDYITDGWYLRQGASIYHRLFKWGPGYCYATHRPPTVHNMRGENLRELHWIQSTHLAHHGILMYHYSLLFPKQVIEKCAYYGNADWAHRNGAQRWAKECFLNLRRSYRIHNVYKYPSWLERFHGTHPPQIEAMQQDIDTGRLDVVMRGTDDIEQLLQSPSYQLGRYILKRLEPFDRLFGTVWRCWRDRLKHFIKDPGHRINKLREKISIFMGR